MAEERQPCVILVTGVKKVGKTFTSCKMIEQYLQPIPSAGRLARKVLLLDLQGEYNNETLQKAGHRFRTKVLALKDLPLWVAQSKIEVRRILPVDDFGNVVSDDEQLKILSTVLKQFKGGLLLLEDFNKLLVSTSGKDIISALISSRHYDCDLLLHVQSLSAATPRIFQNTSFIRFHHQNDSVERIKNRIPSFELFMIAQILVDTEYYNGNIRFYCWVDRELEKIRGKFNLIQYKRAVEEYMTTHRSVIRPFMDKYKGDKDCYVKAMRDCGENLLKYYGNK